VPAYITELRRLFAEVSTRSFYREHFPADPPAARDGAGGRQLNAGAKGGAADRSRSSDEGVAPACLSDLLIRPRWLRGRGRALKNFSKKTLLTGCVRSVPH
jgi:hypothetical protein